MVYCTSKRVRIKLHNAAFPHAVDLPVLLDFSDHHTARRFTISAGPAAAAKCMWRATLPITLCVKGLNFCIDKMVFIFCYIRKAISEYGYWKYEIYKCIIERKYIACTCVNIPICSPSHIWSKYWLVA